MHVLTLKQPWAWAVFFAGKDVENRSILTTHRGATYIHAGRKVDSDGLELLRQLGITPPEHFAHGVILGSVDLFGCITDSHSVWAMPGKWHWLMREPELLPEPIPHRGLPWLHRKEIL